MGRIENRLGGPCPLELPLFRHAVIANAALQRGRPGYTRLTDLERRLRCQKCGARGKASLEVEFRPRD